MYKMQYQQPDLPFENFKTPFEKPLDPDNRWVLLADVIPWADFEKKYAAKMAQNNKGAPGFSVRVALGALIIQTISKYTDDQTVANIQENPYLQFFIGFEEYISNKPPFEPSSLTHFRKRLDSKDISEINEMICLKKKRNKEKNKIKEEEGTKKNSGKLILDATVAPVDIRYPTDISLLNEAREKADKIIDTLHKPWKGTKRRPRTYRNRARKNYLHYAKQKNLSTKARRKGTRTMLGYLRRNLRYINNLVVDTGLGAVNRKQYRDLLVINELYRQQMQMFTSKTNRIDDRIVSISQPHIRPIVRGKMAAPVEFGAKISLSVVNGYSYIDRIEWDSFNEGNDLIMQAENYYKRFKCYPEAICADKIYLNRKNREFAKNNNIRLSGTPLGRPSKSREISRKQKKIEKNDLKTRNQIEGKFGQAKRRYGLQRIMTKLPATELTSIALIFLVINLKRIVKVCRFIFFIFDCNCFFNLKNQENHDLFSRA